MNDHNGYYSRAEHERLQHEHDERLEQRRYAPPAQPGMVVRNGHDKLVGWVWHGGCEHPDCLTAMKAGLRWHAAPLHAYRMPSYHFKTRELAEQALRDSHRPPAPEGVAN